MSASGRGGPRPPASRRPGLRPTAGRRPGKCRWLRGLLNWSCLWVQARAPGLPAWDRGADDSDSIRVNSLGNVRVRLLAYGLKAMNQLESEPPMTPWVRDSDLPAGDRPGVNQPACHHDGCRGDPATPLLQGLTPRRALSFSRVSRGLTHGQSICCVGCTVLVVLTALVNDQHRLAEHRLHRWANWLVTIPDHNS